MKPAGFILKIDQLGRIVIPKPIRKKYDLELGDSLELFNEADGILMKKYCMTCAFCGSDDDLVKFKEKTICEKCLKELKDI
ncbi:MAG: AbrB/MazE/SpoVT family DNA-binding domain-containing protein [Ruminococcaceae bacterium]|nr:AbrB/MazE/SpoVT family DNA-binding domain-containing protein [Oscillospiraceae bacterium]